MEESIAYKNCIQPSLNDSWNLPVNIITGQILPAFSNGESKISLEIAIETALRENPQLNAIREKVKVARAHIDGSRCLVTQNSKLSLLAVYMPNRFWINQGFRAGWPTRTSDTNCKDTPRKSRYRTCPSVPIRYEIGENRFL